MFGYLNLNDPRDIADNEAQEANNCRVDRGYLEFKSWSTDPTRRRVVDMLAAGLAQHFRINATFPQLGPIVRDGAGETGDSPGVPAPGTNVPAIAANVYGMNMYAPGEYEYAITLYDATFKEESAPTVLSVTIGVGEVTQFSTFPALTGSPWDTKSLVFRIYRRPVGGEEFLEIGSTDVAPGTAGPILDITPDNLLDALMDTENNSDVGSLTNLSTMILAFRDRLWFTDGNNTLWFSKAGQPGFTEPTFFFSMTTAIQALEIKDENLYIVTQDRVFILYGNDEDDFSLRDASTQKGGVLRAAGFVGDLLVFGEYDTREVTVTSPAATEDIEVIQSIQAVAGNSVLNISGKLDSLFPLAIRSYDPARVHTYFSFETGVDINRFLAFKHAGTLDTFTFNTAVQLFTALEHVEYLIYDQVMQGFLTGDSGSTFQYRTKEFNQPGRVTQFRTGVVVAEGNLTVEIYGDNELLTTHSFTFTGKTRQRFTVKPQRCSSWSFRFIGDATTKVYEYGRLD